MHARDHVNAALKVADYILWDLVIDLASLNDVDFIGIAQDLKVASALLLPGMSWKQRVIAHIRSPTRSQKMIASEWILRSQSVFPLNSSSNSSGGSSGNNVEKQKRPGLIRLERLSMDDIESDILHLRVRQDNTWSWIKLYLQDANWGAQLKFRLHHCHDSLCSWRDHLVAPAYLEYRMTAFTSLAKQRRTPNGSIRAAIYLVPSSLRKDDEAIARQLSALVSSTCSWGCDTKSTFHRPERCSLIL